MAAATTARDGLSYDERFVARGMARLELVARDLRRKIGIGPSERHAERAHARAAMRFVAFARARGRNPRAAWLAVEAQTSTRMLEAINAQDEIMLDVLREYVATRDRATADVCAYAERVALALADEMAARGPRAPGLGELTAPERRRLERAEDLIFGEPF